ncbi:MAG: iron ABC transporter permease [Desulfobacterales bacterium]|nr:iron ABC transporter permease [Desulfobacterales bacterium]
MKALFKGQNYWILFTGAILSIVCLFFANLFLGTVHISLSQILDLLTNGNSSRSSYYIIITEMRFPKAVTAAFGGASLAVSGLLMQTLFRNVLADPYILGASSGASLGVCLSILMGGMAGSGGFMGVSLFHELNTILAAAVGAGGVMGMMLIISAYVRQMGIVLIAGVMIGSFISAVVGVIIYYASPESVQFFTIWAMGSFREVSNAQLFILVPLLSGGLVFSFIIIKQLNTFYLRDIQAISLGVPLKKVRILVIVNAALLAGTVTSYCGPIAFLGIAVPHLARGLFRDMNHRVLVPATCLLGAAFGLSCSLLAELPGTSHTLPVNAASALLGAPIVTWVLLRRRSMGKIL